MISRGDAWGGLRNALLLLLVLACCLYLPTLSYYSFADDDIYLAYSNRLLRDASWSELYRLLLERANPWEYLPVRDFSYWLDFRLYGDELSGFHLSNLIWYAACCWAVWWLFRELILYCRPGEERHAGVAALLGVVLFALHPAHVESVAWISSRKDLMAGALGLLSLASAVRGVRLRGEGRFLPLAILFFLLACFSKAVAIANAILLVAILFSGYGTCSAKGRVHRWVAAASIGVVAVFAAVVHFNVARESGIGLLNAPGIPAMLDRASRIQAGLVGILLYPHPLQFYYDVYLYDSWHWWFSATSMLLAGIAGVVFLRSNPLWAFGLLLVVVPTVMYLQLSPFTTWSLASERFVFVSVAGLALLFSDLFLRIGNPRYILAIVLLVTSASAYVVWARVQEWEYGYQMLAREYERRPDFHNAIRDRIAFVLLPEKRYGEAEFLAKQLQRTYAAEALLALIDGERAYRTWSDASPRGVKSENPVMRREFCGAVAALRLATRSGYQAIAGEADISYNNILRTLEKFENQRFADARVLCTEAAVAPKLPN